MAKVANDVANDVALVNDVAVVNEVDTPTRSFALPVLTFMEKGTALMRVPRF